MADEVTLHSLPLFVRLQGRSVMLIGEGDAADAKRRLLERAGALIVDEDGDAALAIVALDVPEETVARLRARGILINAVDRPDLCDFTLPAIVDRDPVIVAIGTGGVSAGLAAALRQRLEALLPAALGTLAAQLFAMRGELRARYPDATDRRRAIAGMLAQGGAFDPFAYSGAPTPPAHSGLQLENIVKTGPRCPPTESDARIAIHLTSADPDDLTLRQARALANADRVYHTPDVPLAILNRARADAARIVCAASPTHIEPGSVEVRMA